MAEETVPVPAEAERMEDVPEPSTSVEQVDGVDVDSEAKRLMGCGSKHLVMKDIQSAVAAFQEASSILGKKYGETADECADAFFYYGIALLELARMENGVLGNALDGVPEDEEEGSEKEEDPKIPSASGLPEKERELLREQVYDAMAEKEKAGQEPEKAGKTEEPAAEVKDEKGASEKDKCAVALEVTAEKCTEEKANCPELKEEMGTEGKADTDPELKEEKSMDGKEEKSTEGKADADPELKEEKSTEGKADADPELIEEKSTEGKADADPELIEEKSTEGKADADPELKEEKSIEGKADADPELKEEKSTEGKADADPELKEEKSTEGKADKDPELKEKSTDGKEEGAEEKRDVEMECDKPYEAPESTSTEKVEETPEKVVKDDKTETTSEAVGEVKEAVAAVEESKDAKEQTEEMEADSTQETEEKTADKPKDTKDGSEPAAGSEEAAPKEESADEEQEAEGDEAMEGEEEDEADSEENEGTDEKENEEDDVGNLQLAWEMLELSKIIFKRQQDKASQLKAAQAHLKLGEVSVESENYSQAVEDFLACLTIQKEHMEEHERLLAETHYQLALAYQYNGKHEEAMSHFTQSIEVIEKKMVVLTEKLKKATGSDELQKEMDELKGLLPDIKEKIEDSKEAQKTADVTDKALKETLAGGSSAFPKENGGTSTSAPVEQSPDCTVPVTNCVSDISHLVRKKRKPEESPVKEAKKPKSEPIENGAASGDAVVPTNEEAEKAEQAEKQTAMDTTAVESTA